MLCGNVLRFGYRQNGCELKGALRFNGIKAVRTRAESACTGWHVDGVYDTLSEVEDSVWVKEIQVDTADLQRRFGQKWSLHHYMIYLDSVGCFEFVAESWEALPEETGVWT